MNEPRIVLHGVELSGHTHRVQLLLLMLDLPFRFSPAPADIRRTEAFLKLNPLGQIPVLEDGDLVLSDSNAILVYLVKRYAPGSQWLPEEPVAAALVQRWLSVAAGELRFGPANARVIALWGVPGDRAGCFEIAARILKFMEGHLTGRNWLAAEHATIADLACYSYVAHAPEGGIMLEPYQSVRQWLRRVEGLPSFKPLPASAIPQIA
jgi:glutathione S-transferase